MNKNFVAVLTASCMWVVNGRINAAAVQTLAPTAKVEVFVVPETIVPMEAKKAEDVKPVAVAKDAKPVATTLMNKGVGHENLIIKMVSACDQNNVWCVAADGAKEAVFQLTSKGLEHRFDGVFVAAGKGIVTAINAQREVFELEGGSGTNWRKIEGLKLSKVSRPSVAVGWGLLEKEKGGYSCFAYNDEEDAWEVVKDNEGQPAEGIVDLCANAEEAVLALNDKGELLKGDLHRKQMYEKAKEVMKTMDKAVANKGQKKGKKGKKAAARDTDGKGKKGKKAAAGVSAAEKEAEAAHPADKKKHGKKGKKGKKAAAGMIDADHDGKDDRDADGDGKVSKAEKAAYDAANK